MLAPNTTKKKKTQGSVKEQIAALVAGELDGRTRGAKGTSGSRVKSKKKSFEISKI